MLQAIGAIRNASTGLSCPAMHTLHTFIYFHISIRCILGNLSFWQTVFPGYRLILCLLKWFAVLLLYFSHLIFHFYRTGKGECTNDHTSIISGTQWKRLVHDSHDIEIKLYAFQFVTSKVVQIECFASVCSIANPGGCSEVRRIYKNVGLNQLRLKLNIIYILLFCFEYLIFMCNLQRTRSVCLHDIFQICYHVSDISEAYVSF